VKAHYESLWGPDEDDLDEDDLDFDEDLDGGQNGRLRPRMPTNTSELKIGDRVVYLPRTPKAERGTVRRFGEEADALVHVLFDGDVHTKACRPADIEAEVVATIEGRADARLVQAAADTEELLDGTGSGLAAIGALERSLALREHFGVWTADARQEAESRCSCGHLWHSRPHVAPRDGGES